MSTIPGQFMGLVLLQFATPLSTSPNSVSAYNRGTKIKSLMCGSCKNVGVNVKGMFHHSGVTYVIYVQL